MTAAQLTDEEIQAKHLIMTMELYQVPGAQDLTVYAQTERAKKCALKICDIIIDALGPLEKHWRGVKKCVADYNSLPPKKRRNNRIL